MARKKSSQPWYFKYVKAQLRRIWGWSPERKAAKKRAQVGKDIRGNEYFRCERCDEQPLSRKQVDVDHLVEVESLGEFDGWDALINRLFCPSEGLMILCKTCHAAKTVVNNRTRKQARKAAK
jgi:hypothetical protein